ncbi:MAG: trehalase family glycosidase, partial [Calditrichota bacterium]
YFPSADYWNSNVSDFAPKELRTSGITQPAVHGFVLEDILEYDFDINRIATLYDQIVHYHQYLYEYRQFKETGLVAIWHNWESGMDNSPLWDSVFKRIHPDVLKDVTVKRKDIHSVEDSAATRPTDEDYKRYIYLVNYLREHKYEHVPEDYPFQVLDQVFNAILIQSNKSLLRIGKRIGKDTSLVESWIERAEKHFSEILWNKEDGLFYPYDILSGQQVKIHCAASYIPLFAELADENQLNALIENLNALKDMHLVPSCIPGQPGFQAKNYWRGPVWIHMNWMISEGLRKYQQHELADRINSDSIRLIEEYGIREYFDPLIKIPEKNGYGGQSFSWSAALTIDMIKKKK